MGADHHAHFLPTMRDRPPGNSRSALPPARAEASASANREARHGHNLLLYRLAGADRHGIVLASGCGAAPPLDRRQDLGRGGDMEGRRITLIGFGKTGEAFVSDRRSDSPVGPPRVGPAVRPRCGGGSAARRPRHAALSRRASGRRRLDNQDPALFGGEGRQGPDGGMSARHPPRRGGDSSPRLAAGARSLHRLATRAAEMRSIAAPCDELALPFRVASAPADWRTDLRLRGGGADLPPRAARPLAGSLP